MVFMKAGAGSVALSRQPSAHRLTKDSRSPKARMKYVKSSSHHVTNLSVPGMSARGPAERPTTAVFCRVLWDEYVGCGDELDPNA
jgi:hypothetical protein